MASSADCPLEGCSRVFLTYSLSLGGNVALLALFAVLIPVTLAMGIRYNNTIFSTALATGLALEVMGYIGRILMSTGAPTRSSFTVFLLGTIIGPNFIFGAMVYVMQRIITLYGQEFQTWRRTWYFNMLYGLTVLSLVLEIAGGAVSTSLLASDTVNPGDRVLAVGLAIHLVALVIFTAHAGLFAIAVRTRHHILDPTHAPVYNSGLFRVFLIGFSAATFFLILRTAFRIVVIAEGFASSVAQAEVLFLVFDGVMVFIASGILLALFPGRVFGRSWRETSPRHPAHKPTRPPRPLPVQLLPTHQNPGLNKMNLKPAAHPENYPEHPSRKTYAPPPAHRNMVDSESLW
ncbi:putative rta1 domain protein [Eutypa lata UCREL1]|uniref:Putative rta1 domain protein n=1 Tax=Eutypa lata (strain UCR-EL1) TaxID=1287681 RepID=M7S8C9_EUTLA|nr:putative rta1 domain protein [Eutypa lata UCREL1]